MKIIIEGPNNVGKSTLIEQIMLQNPIFKVEHLSGDCPNDLKFHLDLLSSRDNIIFDRFCIGELVYSEIYARKPKLTVDDYKELLSFNEDEVIWILVDADYEFIKNACDRKGDKFDYEIVKREREYFLDYCHGVDKIIYVKNHIKGSYENEIGQVDEVLRRLKNRINEYRKIS